MIAVINRTVIGFFPPGALWACAHFCFDKPVMFFNSSFLQNASSISLQEPSGNISAPSAVIQMFVKVDVFADNLAPLCDIITPLQAKQYYLMCSLIHSGFLSVRWYRMCPSTCVTMSVGLIRHCSNSHVNKPTQMRCACVHTQKRISALP